MSVCRLALPGCVEAEEPKIVLDPSEPVKPSTDVKGDESDQDLLSANYETKIDSEEIVFRSDDQDADLGVDGEDEERDVWLPTTNSMARFDPP